MLFAQSKTADSTRWEAMLADAKENYNQGNYPEAMQVALSIHQAAVQARDNNTIADAANVIGLVDLAQGKPRQALSYFRRALQLNRTLANRKRMAANLLNIALVHSDLQRLDSAVIFLGQSLEISRAVDAKNLIAMGRNHLGDTYLRQHKLRSAAKAFRSVLEDKDYQSDWENSFASTGMAKVFFARQGYRQAALYADRAYTMALAADAKWDAARAMELAHRAYRAMGDMSSAYERLLAYKTHTDSLFNVDKERELNGMRLRSKSIENENLKNHIQLVSQQRHIEKLVLAVTIIALILIVTYAVLIYRRHQKSVMNNRRLAAEKQAAELQKRIVESQNDALNLINKDHNRLFSIIGHDLRSPFNAIENTLGLFRAGYLDQRELSLLIEKLTLQLSNASSMLNSLLLWSANQMDGISQKPVEVNLHNKVDKVLGVFLTSANHKKINLIHEKSAIPSVFGDADQIKIMIQNLISNAIKFTPINGTVKISYALGDDHLSLAIEDNGVGISSDKLEAILTGTQTQGPTYGTDNEKGIGLGLYLVRDFASNNNISFDGESKPGKGTTFILRFYNIPQREEAHRK